jgi:uncharacterized protein YeaO (DUF488 family)
VKRVYDDAEESDGRRVLVDRVWPRGLRKDRAAVAEWLRDVAPSTELRRWYGHDPERFAEFARRYRAELAGPVQSDALARLRRYAEGTLTLVTAVRDLDHAHTAVLADVLAR